MTQQMLTVGVAMCVFNGERFLSEQLTSIATQDILPTSMVVFDDGSTDGTWELLQIWAENAPFPVQVQRNTVQLGVVRNFEQACSMLDTELVFLADQDDIWFPHKVRTFVDAFTADPQLLLLHSDADLIDGAGQKLSRRLFDTLLVTASERELVEKGLAWQVYTKRNLVTGAACAFRRQLLEFTRPFSQLWLHDEWLAFHAALVGRVRLFPESVMAYRLHSSNTVGLPLPTFAWRLRTTIQAFTEPTVPRQLARTQRLYEIVAAAHRLSSPPVVIEYLVRCAQHAHFRSTLQRNPMKRLPGVFREYRAGNYNTWSNGVVSMLHDLLIAR